MLDSFAQNQTNVSVLSTFKVGHMYTCHASVCSLVLCLVTTKIWSDGH